MRNLCAEASLIPIRTITDITAVSTDSLRATDVHDFKEALTLVSFSIEGISTIKIGILIEILNKKGNFAYTFTTLFKPNYFCFY